MYTTISMFFVFIYAFWCPIRGFHCQMIFVSFNSNTTSVINEVETANPSGALAFSGERVARSLVFCPVFCRSLLVPLSLFLSLYPSIYDFWWLATHLQSFIFKDISWRFGLWCLTPLSTICQLYHGGLVYYVWNHFQQYFSYIMAVWFIMFETTFHNISAISWRFCLLCLKPLSTIFQLYHSSLVYYVWNHFQQYFSYIMAVSFIDEGNGIPGWKQLTCRKALTYCFT